MINYLLINFILSTAALAINQWLQIPHRFRFYTLMVAVVAWLVPFGMIDIEISQQSAAVLPIQVIELSQPMSTVNHEVSQQFSFSYLFGMFLLIGLLLFIRELFLSHNFIKQLKPKSTTLPNNQYIRLTESINGAFVSGYTKPTIWINPKYQHEDNMQTIITHEQQHIKSHDQIWLIIITFVQRLMWFNPLAYLLCQKSRQAIELSCDEACKQKIGPSKYQTHLAEIMLNNSQAQDMLLHNPINHSKHFNISRIEQLNKENLMTKSNTSKFTVITLTAIFLSSFTLITVAKDTTPTGIKDHQVLLTLKIQNGEKKPTELSILTNQGEVANVTYDNHDFGFTTQVMPEESTQIYTNIIISEIQNNIKTKIANPGIVTTNKQWGGFKFGAGENYFDIDIMAQTSSQLDPVTEAVDNHIKINDPLPVAMALPVPAPVLAPVAAPQPAAESIPKTPPQPATETKPNQPPKPTSKSAPSPIKAPVTELPKPPSTPNTPPEPTEVDAIK